MADERKPGERLREWRKRAGMTQESLAAALGITQGAVCAIEQGATVEPRARVAEKIRVLTNGEVRWAA